MIPKLAIKVKLCKNAITTTNRRIAQTMTEKQQKPFGTWPSSLSAMDAAAASLRLDAIAATSQGVLWIEGRPEESGRLVICGLDEAGRKQDLLPAPYSARSRVHEYGGGALHATGGRVFFINDADQDIYELTQQGPLRITDAPDLRFADMCHDAHRNRLIAVAERHGDAHEPENLLAAIDLAAARRGAVSRLISGGDFYAAPRLGPDGRTLAYLAWNHSHMPWDAAELHVATLGDDGAVTSTARLAGGAAGAAFQPQWTPDGLLYFVEEKGDGSGLYAWRDGRVTPVFLPEGELLLPLWNFGMASYALLASGRIAALVLRDGEQQFVCIDPQAGSLRAVPMPCRQVLLPVAAGGADGIFAIAQYDAAPPAIVSIDVSNGRADTLYRSGAPLDLAATSVGRTLWLRHDGHTVPAVYYPPMNAGFTGPDGEKPPLIVTAHGGPTARADRGLRYKVQFWTSRGFAFLDVDYRGSTGYGASHRKALDGAWGIADPQDVNAAALAAAAQGLADRERLFVSGGSAGGYTALMAIVGDSVFRAAGVSYGVADLASLLATTHKFEASYLYCLTGTTAGATEPAFTQRSPLHQASRITVPTIFFQGLLDKVVPPQQSQAMADALAGNGVPVALIEFALESHGFRARDAIANALNWEYAFYCKILGVEPQEPCEPFHISNWA